MTNISFYAKNARPDKQRKEKMYRKYFSNCHSILDLGCSIGMFLQHSPKKIVGFDRDFDSLRTAAATGAPLVCGNLDSRFLPFKDCSFKAVNMDNIIEHLSARAGEHILHEIYRILKKDGMIFIRTPVLYRMGKRFYIDPEHVIAYGKDTLKNLLEKSGFTIKYAGYWSYNYLRFLPKFKILVKVFDFLEDIIAKFISDNWFFLGIKS